MTPFFKDMVMKQVACGLTYVCAIISTGDVYSWGDNTFKQLGYNLKKGKDRQDTPKLIDYFHKNNI